MFETPSVLRESLPSYSAKPGAFYAPRALRWTTPPRGRTDPFQGPKIKPMFHRFSLFFKTILGSEMEANMEAKLVQNQAQEPSETLLEPGCRAMRFSEALGSVLGTPGTSKIVLPLQCGPNFCSSRGPRRGVQNRPQSDPKSRPNGLRRGADGV